MLLKLVSGTYRGILDQSARDEVMSLTNAILLELKQLGQGGKISSLSSGT
jgi:hypothetical protein